MGKVSPEHKAEESLRLDLRLAEVKAKLGTHCVSDWCSIWGGQREDKKETL